jgi:hypothetical protein
VQWGGMLSAIPALLRDDLLHLSAGVLQWGVQTADRVRNQSLSQLIRAAWRGLS